MRIRRIRRTSLLKPRAFSEEKTKVVELKPKDLDNNPYDMSSPTRKRPHRFHNSELKFGKKKAPTITLNDMSTTVSNFNQVPNQMQ